MMPAPRSNLVAMVTTIAIMAIPPTRTMLDSTASYTMKFAHQAGWEWNTPNTRIGVAFTLLGVLCLAFGLIDRKYFHNTRGI